MSYHHEASVSLPPINTVKKPSVNPMDAAMALHQALNDLDAVKRQLKQPFMAKASVEAQLDGITAGLRMKSQSLLAASWAQAQAQHDAVQEAPLGVVFKPKSLKPLSHSKHEKVAAFKADFVSRPQSESAREYLKDRFGIPLPSKPSSAEGRLNSAISSGSLTRGLTPAITSTSIILPGTTRHDPFCIAPIQVADRELSKGLMHLINRGLLPSRVDVTPALVGDAGAVRSSLVTMHPYQSQFVRPPVTTALEDSLMAASGFRLDLLTPVVPPAQVSEDVQKSMRFATLGDREPRQQSSSHVVEAEAEASTSSEAHRPFDVLMDTFSLHEFMIRRGRLIVNTPEFESYRRTYEPMWDVLSALIGQLESLCQNYTIPLAIVDGKSLADLAQSAIQTGQEPLMQDLLVCFQNIQEVAVLLTQPGRRYQAEGGEAKAAVAIQAAWRGHRTYQKLSKEGRAATKIQGAWRLHKLKKMMLEKMQAARNVRDEKFQALQQQLYQQWPLLQRHTHIVVHVPSMHRSGQGMTSEQIDTMLALEASQLARLCDLAEPLVEVLLILPSPPDDDVVAYWNKILEVGGVIEPTSRYRILWPENYSRLPIHMGSAARMLSSPHSMKRVKDALRGRMAYMLPGSINEEEVDLAVQLGLPLLGPAPYTAHTLARKSAARTLFRSAGAITPPGLVILPASELPPASRLAVGVNGVAPLRPGTDFAITPDGDVIVNEAAPPAPKLHSAFIQAESRVLRLLAEAMVRCPTVNKWLLKVDDESFGCGHAFFETLSLTGASDVLERAYLEAQQLPTDSSLDSEPLQPLSEGQQVSVFRLNELLKSQLPKKLTLAAKDVYRTYREYIFKLAERGGVIEACPDMTVGSPCVNIFVAPTGQVSILSTHERIFVHPYRSVGSTFPQSSVPHRALADAATNIGASCYRAGVIGHVGIDFVTMQEMDGSLRLWAVDVDTAITPTVMAFQMFDFLTVGTFDPYTGSYSVQPDPSALNDDDGGDDSASVQQQALDGGSTSLSVAPRAPSVTSRATSVAARSNAGGEEASTSQRFYFSLDLVSHSGIAASTCAKFFHACWQEGFHYDVDHRMGVIFNLSDKYLAGALGVLTVGMVPHEMYAVMQRVLAFISQRGEELPVTQKAAWNSSHKPTTFRDLQSLVKYMAEKSVAVSLGLIGAD